MNNEIEERELVPVRVKSNKPSWKDTLLNDVPDPEEIEQLVKPKTWHGFNKR